MLHGIDYDYLIHWGHYRLVAELHERLQGHLDDPWTDAVSKATLGMCYRLLGKFTRAIELHERALSIDREIGFRYGEAMDLASLGKAHGNLGLWDKGARYCQQAIEVADSIGNVQAQTGARHTLARIQLRAGDLPAALQTVTAARDHDPPAKAGLSLLSGIVWLRQDQPTAAAQEFHSAITHADEQLQQTSGDYQALDTKALALCGLALTTDPAKAAEASTVFHAARTITSAEGIVNQTLALFNALAAADRGGILAGVRPALKGDTA